VTGPLRVIVTGGRQFKDDALIFTVLQALPADALIVHGGALGADQRVANMAHRLGFLDEPHRAYWKRCAPDCPKGHQRTNKQGSWYCPTAGLRRNSLMADLGADVCIAFPGGSGTQDMRTKAHGAGIWVLSALDLASWETPIDWDALLRERHITSRSLLDS
jgi:hypothetical protein